MVHIMGGPPGLDRPCGIDHWGHLGCSEELDIGGLVFGANQLRLVVHHIIYRGLAPSQVVGNGSSEPSTVCYCPGEYEFCRTLEPIITLR